MNLAIRQKNLIAVVSVAFLIVGGVRVAHGQETIIKPGATVRFRFDNGDPYRIGQVWRLTPDSLTLEHCDNCDRMRYDRREFTRFDVSRRVAGAPRMIKGILIGAFVGVTGDLAGACNGGAKCEFANGPLLTIVGGALGGITAYLTSYIWDPVPAGAVSRR